MFQSSDATRSDPYRQAGRGLKQKEKTAYATYGLNCHSSDQTAPTLCWFNPPMLPGATLFDKQVEDEYRIESKPLVVEPNNSIATGHTWLNTTSTC